MTYTDTILQTLESDTQIWESEVFQNHTDTILQTLESDTQIWESEVFQNKNIDLIDKNQNISTEKEETVKELPTSTEMFPAQPQTLTTSEDSTTESKEVDHVVEKQADELTEGSVPGILDNVIYKYEKFEKRNVELLSDDESKLILINFLTSNIHKLLIQRSFTKFNLYPNNSCFDKDMIKKIFYYVTENFSSLFSSNSQEQDSVELENEAFFHLFALGTIYIDFFDFLVDFDTLTELFLFSASSNLLINLQYINQFYWDKEIHNLQQKIKNSADLECKKEDINNKYKANIELI